jgi:GH43 family beta-xylosidase
MKKFKLFVILVLSLLVSGVVKAQVPTKLISYKENPFIRHIYTADPSAHVWNDGRLYVYCSHDIDPPRGCDLMDEYHVFSTDDMVNWVDHGCILTAADVKWGRPEGGFMWAPDCAYKNGKYYFYFPHPSDSHWQDSFKIGVAVSKKPASDFKSVKYIKLNGVKTCYDPCVFVDDDGQAYLYVAGDKGMIGGKLKDNMMETDGDLQLMKGLVDPHEAPYVHKYNGKYYFTYADNHNDGVTFNQLRYAISDSPLGPWKYMGVFVGSTDSATDHGSIVQFKGQWYLFYHNSNLSNYPWLRSLCFDKLYYNPDGSIKLVKQTGMKISQQQAAQK